MQIRVEVEGKDTLSLESLTEFQGNLKELSKENYEKLKNDILTLGFISPIHIWKNKNKYFCLDGHQRIRTLQQMQKEGITIPPLPVVYVQAKNEKEAKQKILSLTSSFGEITKEGLYEFISDSGIDFKDVKNQFHFHEIDFDKFEDEFYVQKFDADERTSNKMPLEGFVFEALFPTEKEMNEAKEYLESLGFIVEVKNG